MEFLCRSRLHKGSLAASLTMLWPIAAFAQTLPAADDVRVSIPALARSESPLRLAPFFGATGNRWATSIAAAANTGLIEAGTEAAVAAVRDCQRGDYPGGGVGLLSLPFGRSGSRTDHCFR